MDELKLKAAQAAIRYIQEGDIVGIGTGSTTNFFIQEIAKSNIAINGLVASSAATLQLLHDYNLPVFALNDVMLDVYVDGADACNDMRQLIKGGGGALTQEKVLAAASPKFVCIVDITKTKGFFQHFVPIEVIPMAKGHVAREIVKLGGRPELRLNYTTDNGNVIIDVHGLDLSQPMTMESRINNIAGVLENGIFANNYADILLVADSDNVSVIQG